MAQAEVGDDVFGEDPTVNRLEERVATLLGKPAALFVPSGTMANQISLRVHTRPGDELLCEQGSHICQYEAGGPAVLSGVMCRTIPGRRGILDVADLEGRISPDDNHYCRTRLVALENTHNRGGGSIYPLENIERIGSWAKAHGLAMHLDGARLMNAVVATGISADRWSRAFDTVSICFSKGLGAPVGSAVAASSELIREARRVRKVLGGAMRQAGVLAAACLFALDHNVDRLAEDHANAQILALALADTPGFEINPAEVESNLVWVQVSSTLGTAKQIADKLRQENILVIALGPQTLRMCTHLDVSRDDVLHCAKTIRKLGRS
jgi:threonine aldolase